MERLRECTLRQRSMHTARWEQRKKPPLPPVDNDLLLTAHLPAQMRFSETLSPAHGQGKFSCGAIDYAKTYTASHIVMSRFRGREGTARGSLVRSVCL